jgi:NADPH:quinone reductase-like Zn-dependent oxidoreductase
VNTRTYTLFEITTDPQRLRRAVEFVDAGLADGGFTPVADRTFDFAEAHRYMRADAHVGKIVVTVRHDG